LQVGLLAVAVPVVPAEQTLTVRTVYDDGPFEFVTDEVLGVEFPSAFLTGRRTPRRGITPTPEEVGVETVPVPFYSPRRLQRDEKRERSGVVPD